MWGVLIWEKAKDLELFIKWILVTEELHVATFFKTKSKNPSVCHLTEVRSEAIVLLLQQLALYCFFIISNPIRSVRIEHLKREAGNFSCMKGYFGPNQRLV